MPGMGHHSDFIALTSAPSRRLRGRIRVPGDKSISHRALMLASQAIGTTIIHGLLEGEDVLRTAEALRACGVDIVRREDGSWCVKGVGIGGLAQPDAALDMGNAGTGARLMMGLLAPYPYKIKFEGDASLSKRPMQRVIAPLTEMGANFAAQEGGRLPLVMTGAKTPLPIDYVMNVPSAQVKSAILLAALNTPGRSSVLEHEATRDHSERMLGYFGIPITTARQADGATLITLQGQPKQHYENREFRVPGDPSSAAFPIVAALITPDSEVTVEEVCLNPLRTGLFQTLLEMGANLTFSNQREIGGEIVGDITAKTSRLTGVDVPAARAPSMIDEYPILAMAAATANGRSIMRGLSELRVKESDRLAAIIEGLHKVGVEAIEEGDNLILHGRGAIPQGGATITSHYDHRIAMSFLVLGLVAAQPITVDDGRAIATSFPVFTNLMNGLGAKLHVKHEKQTASRSKLVIAVDGPAASGKGTLARRLADHFGLSYLDTGSLYRAVGMRVVYADKNPGDVAAAIAAARAIQDHDLANPKIRSERIGKAASIVSAIPEVRAALLDYQRDFARRANGAVLDGRDIGTIICPDADYKFFVTASLETRAQRRHKELSEMGVKVDYDSVVEDLRERDQRDAERAVAPLKPAPDAAHLDTSHLSANDVFEQALGVIEGEQK
jgi:3-phosphoshikimate 1-carboxyvinyltransferase